MRCYKYFLSVYAVSAAQSIFRRIKLLYNSHREDKIIFSEKSSGVQQTAKTMPPIVSE